MLSTACCQSRYRDANDVVFSHLANHAMYFIAAVASVLLLARVLMMLLYRKLTMTMMVRQQHLASCHALSLFCTSVGVHVCCCSNIKTLELFLFALHAPVFL